jgi:hypothetical protein
MLLLTSCATQKQSSSQKDQVTEKINEDGVVEAKGDQAQTENNYSVGKVVLSQEGCAFSLILEDEDDVCYYPVNLDEKFRVDGVILQFQKFPSRAPLPAGCESCRTIQVEQVEQLKR